MANEPTFNPNAYREFAEIERRNRAVQDLYEPGSTFKVVTASAAIEEKVMPIDTLIDTSPAVDPHRRRASSRRQRHNYGVLSFTDVIVKSSNVGAIKIGFRVGTDRLSRLRRSGSASASRCRRIFPARTPASSGSATKWTDSALASVSMGYQVGVTPLQMVAAVSSVANGGEYVEPRVVRAVYRDNRRYAVQAEGGAARRSAADTAATLTGDHGRGRRARHREAARRFPATRSPARPAPRTSWSTAATRMRTTTRRSSASCRRAIRRSRSSSCIDSPHGPNGHSAARCPAPIFKRIAEATLRYLGVAADDQSGAAGARRAHATSRRRADRSPRRRSRRSSTSWSRTPARHGARRARPERARSDAQARRSSA